MLYASIQVLGGLGAVVFGADRFVTGAAQTARTLGITPLVIGLTVVGIATSMPEALVSAVAAFGGNTGIAIGNVPGSNIANIGLVNNLLIGLTVVAVGTRLPELATSVISALKGEPDIAIGNVIGSNMFNMLLVLGIPGLVHPGPFRPEAFTRDFAVMAALTTLLGCMIFLRDRRGFSRAEGGTLLASFLLYQGWLFSAGGA